MKIEAVTLREIRMPLVHFFETSFDRTTARRILLITVHSDGLNGWGECVAGENPYYNEECVDTAWMVLTRYLVPSVLGKNIDRGREFPGLVARVRGNRMRRRNKRMFRFAGC